MINTRQLTQRLIRQLCTNCRIKHQLDPQEIAWLDSGAIDNFMNLQFYTAEGCTKCNNTGYSGRVSIYEVLEPDAAMLQALRKEDHDAFINAAGVRVYICRQNIKISDSETSLKGEY